MPPDDADHLDRLVATLTGPQLLAYRDALRLDQTAALARGDVTAVRFCERRIAALDAELQRRLGED